MKRPDWFAKADQIHRAVLANGWTWRVITPYGRDDLVGLTLGLAGEAGEVANDVKKHLRGDFDEVEMRERLAKELADVRIYLEMLAEALNVDLDVAVADKLVEVEKRWRAKGFL